MKEKKEPNPANLYTRGDSWICDFYFKGQRYTEALGPVSRSRAKEIRDKRKGDAAAGSLVVNGKRWLNKEWVAEIRAPKIEDSGFEAAIEKYLDWYKANRKPNSYQRHSYAQKPLLEFFAGKRLSEISAFEVEKYKLGRKGAGKQPATINRELALLSNLYTMAIKWKLAVTNPTADVAPFKESSGRTRYLNEEEGARVLGNCQPGLHLVVLAAILSGLRTSELKQTTWARVDFLNKLITVPAAYSKNGEPRSVSLHPDLEEALRREYDKRKPNAEDFVFLNDRDGKPWKSWRSAFKTALKKAGITDFRFHDLRHCFGSYLAMNGTGLKAMMELMGHKRSEMTLRYSHVSTDYKRAAVAKLPSFGKMVSESQQISQQPKTATVVKLAK